MKNKYMLLLLASICLACNKQNKIERAFITEESEYWAFYSQFQGGFYCDYLKFYSDSTYNEFITKKINLSDIELNNDEEDEDRFWYVTEDSIMNWSGHRLDVVSYNSKAIVLIGSSGPDSYVFLIKTKKENFRKGDPFYEKKRQEHPEKYPPRYK